jgi:hypothetical protein
MHFEPITVNYGVLNEKFLFKLFFHASFGPLLSLNYRSLTERSELKRRKHHHNKI